MTVRCRARALSRVLLLAMVMPFLVLLTPASAAAATSLYVAKGNAQCSDSGPGTQTRPFCTISRAAEAAGAGDTVLVYAGTYVEEVVPVNSGTATAPITYRAAPGQSVTVTSSGRAFEVRSKSWITISGFHVTGTVDYGIYLRSAANVVVSNNRVSFAGEPVSGETSQGIYVLSSRSSQVLNNTTDHNTDAGIYVATGNTAIEVRGNRSFANARGYTRAASGIDIRSPGTVVTGNVSFDNEDSGIQLYNGAHTTRVVSNVAYGNGDHGIDVLNSTDTVVVSNSVYDNATAGINLEGASGTPASSRGTLRNNISVDNGIGSTSTRGNVRVDARSLTGTTLNWDIVHLSTAGTMFTWGTTPYTSLAAFRTATGQEASGLEADPLWVAPATGDFHLRNGSPAIDSADSAAPGQPASDIESRPRIDDVSVPNSGVGPRAYDDRGAYEHKPAPVAVVAVSPPSGPAPLTVQADATGSSSPVGITSYAFDWGDGSTTAPQPSLRASHTYPTAGTYTVTLTVTDAEGQRATATDQVRALSPDEPPNAVLSVTPSSGAAPLTVLADASASSDPDVTPIESFTFDFGDGTVVGPQAGATATHTYPEPGSFTVTVTVTDTGGQSSTATDSVTVTDPNLVGNAGFETTTNGWNTSGRAGVTLSRVPVAHTGAWGGEVTNTTGVTQPDCTLNDAPNWVTSTLPGVYRASLWVRGDATGRVVKLRVREYSGGLFLSSSPVVQVTTSSTWQKLSVEMTPQQTGSTLDLTAFVTNAAPGTCFVADDVRLTRSTVPAAALSVTPESGTAPLLVEADASGSTSVVGIASYSFDWGDGSPATGAQVSPRAPHTYTTPGTYTVTVTVTDLEGQRSTATAQARAKASDAPPEAAVVVTPPTGAAALTVTADASGSTSSGSTPIQSFTFDFGDGTVAGPQPGPTAQHTYPDPGSFTVTVTVTDTVGRSSTAIDTVTVTDPNVVGNPGFETSTNGWNTGGHAGVTLSRAPVPRSGDWAGQVTNTTSVTQPDCTLNDAPNWVTTAQSGTYRASLWVRSDAGDRVVKLRLREYAGGVFVGSSPVVQATVGAAWQQLTVDISPQSTGSTLDLTAYVTNAAPGTCFTVDDISMIRL